MRRNWLLYLLFFSLALNLGTIGTLIYWRWQGPKEAAMKGAEPPGPLKELWGRLPLDQEQRQVLRRCLQDHHLQVKTLRQELAQKRLELLELFKQPSQEWAPIREKVREITEKQGQVEEALVRSLFELQKNLTPEQRAEFLRVLEHRLPRRLWGGPPGGHHGGGPCSSRSGPSSGASTDFSK